MDSVVSLEKRLNQLQAESRILDRLVYKGKNQHRRCTYFQFLLKVRRDSRLVQSAGLEGILNSVSQLMDSKKPKDTVRLLESLKKRKHSHGMPNFQERLLGVARLLSQMVDPMVKASMEISCLLAQSFFMGFSVTILALLARLRVLVQQMLLDVSIFNTISSIAQKEHSVKLIKEGIEFLRDYYPANEVLTLDCIWKTDKFVLLEKTNKIKDQDGEPEVGREISLGTSNIQYQTIDAFLGDDETGCKTDNNNFSEDLLGTTNSKRHKAQ